MNQYHLEYNQKLTTPEKAVARIKNGDTMVVGTNVAEPPALLGAIADRARRGDLEGLKVYSTLALQHSAETVLSPDLADCIQAYSWFVSAADRPLVKVGLTYFVPNHLGQVPRLIRDYMKIDVTITTVSPMDEAGYFSFGTANDITSTAARYCNNLIVEVNENMPRVFGDSLLHISEVNSVVENHVPLQELSAPKTRPEDRIIGKYIAELIPDGATIQLGVGGIGNSVAQNLSEHKDLGIHSGVFCPPLMDLIKSGIVTGKKKTIHPRKNVFTLAQGNKEMYEFMNNNPSMESFPISYTNDPAVISRNDNMVSINFLMQVDLTGQCNAEYMGGAQFSGTGGQSDFVRGAFNSRGGRAILAFRSTAKDGTISSVVPRLDPGTVITTSRNDVQYLITEYGVIDIKGKSTRERVLDIIGIAHPKFRDELMKEAEEMYLI